VSLATRYLLAGGVLLAAAGIGLVSYERTRDQLAVIDACQATRSGDWTTALAKTRGRVDADATGRAAAECRCLALLATNGAAECSALMQEILEKPEAEGWTPNPTLAIHLIQTWRDEGRALAAAELARRASRQRPHDADLFYLELVTRSNVERGRRGRQVVRHAGHGLRQRR
jgi:hypothetical protein